MTDNTTRLPCRKSSTRAGGDTKNRSKYYNNDNRQCPLLPQREPDRAERNRRHFFRDAKFASTVSEGSSRALLVQIASVRQGVTRILLVEDDEVQQKLLSAALNKAIGNGSYMLRHADRLSRALVLLREEKFDIVLLDLNLPDSTGIETLRTTKSEAPDAAIIVLTGEDDDELGAQVVREGAQDFLTKGKFPIETLGRSILYAIERHGRLEDLKNLALLDELTGLFNRRGFMALAWHQLKVATRTKRPITVLFLDIDGMKKINDTQGHHNGDAALLAVADILRARFRESDIVARVGGDEFCALLVDDLGTDPLTRVRSCLDTLDSSDRAHPFSVSMGAVRYDANHPCSVEDLLERADEDMYRSKRAKQERPI